MRVRVGCEFEFECETPVPALMLVRARPDGANRTVYESRWGTPPLAVREYRDSFGNACWRLTFPAGVATVRYDAIVDLDDAPAAEPADTPLTPVAELPDDVLAFTLASRYVESDLLSEEAWSRFGAAPATWGRVLAVRDWVRANVRVEPGPGRRHVTAREVLERRAGVGRDVALLVVALCRALNVPARYAFGYSPETAADVPDAPSDFHAWCEAFVGGRWLVVDPRARAGHAARVVVGHGRDAVDVALTTAYGDLRLVRMDVWAGEVQMDAVADRRVADRRAPSAPAMPNGVLVPNGPGLRPAEPRA